MLTVELSHPVNPNLSICVFDSSSTGFHFILCWHLALYSTSIDTALSSVIMSLKNGAKLSFVTGNANKLKEVQAILLDSQGRLLEIEPKDYDREPILTTTWILVFPMLVYLSSGNPGYNAGDRERKVQGSRSTGASFSALKTPPDSSIILMLQRLMDHVLSKIRRFVSRP